MRISAILFKENDPRLNGLKAINLTSKPLGSTVVLVGKNGSGKSRILNLITNFANDLTVDDLINSELVNTPAGIEEQIIGYKNQINRSLRNSAISSLDKIRTNYNINPLKSLLSPYITKIDLTRLTQLNKKNENVLFENLFKQKNLNKDFEMLFSESTVKYIQGLSDELNLEKYNSLVNQDPENFEEKATYKKFLRLQWFIELFVGKKISYSAKKIKFGEPFTSNVTINNRPFDISHFSPGERILFSYAVLFYLFEINSTKSLEDSIIIIDEPENHLHPSAQIQLISAIKEIIKDKGQLWIATHSLPLISSLQYDEIFLVKNDTIIPPNRYNPGNSILELMESENNSFRLNQFLISSSEWAYTNFMVQCFSEPDVHFSSSKNDIQINTLTDLLLKKQKIKILDYGAGRGRLAKAMSENPNLKERIGYYAALEPNTDFIDDLKQNKFIKEIYTDNNSIPDNSFDIVLFFNVLHEINPEEWRTLFRKIKNILTESGMLLIVEDKYLPKGEKINKYGYLILNELQILDLFGIDHKLKDNYNPLLPSQDNRITFSTIPKNEITITNSSILNSIDNLNKEVFGKMEELRGKMTDLNSSKSDLSIGRKYAHYSQLYINTSIALKYLPKEIEIESLF